MGTRSLDARLSYNADADLTKLLEHFRAGRVEMFPAGLEQHFRVAKEKPATFRDHESVLAISIGGSNTKAMLAHTERGRFIVRHVVDRPNPQSRVTYKDYFDELFMFDEVFRAYLKNQPSPYVGFSIAIPIIDGVPFHKVKIPNLDGLIARDWERDALSHHMGRNLADYFASRGIGGIKFWYQDDAIVAHLGAVSCYHMDHEEKSILLVCGNGMACGDEDNFVLVGMAHTLDDDEKLYPADETEDHQYQYLIAGKGLYCLMARAIRFKSREPGSVLEESNVLRYFATDRDSRNVVDIWESTLPEGLLRQKTQEILKSVGPRAYGELQWIARMIMLRGIDCIANCLVATITNAGPAPSGKPYTVFFEGSIVNNGAVLPRVKSQIVIRIKQSTAFERVGILRPKTPRFAEAIETPRPAAGVSFLDMEQVDLALIGASALAISGDCVGSQ